VEGFLVNLGRVHLSTGTNRLDFENGPLIRGSVPPDDFLLRQVELKYLLTISEEARLIEWRRNNDFPMTLESGLLATFVFCWILE